MFCTLHKYFKIEFFSLDRILCQSENTMLAQAEYMRMPIKYQKNGRCKVNSPESN